MSDAEDLFGSSSGDDDGSIDNKATATGKQQFGPSDINRTAPTNELNELFGSDDEDGTSGLLPIGNKLQFQKIKSILSGKLCLSKLPKIDPDNSTLILKMPNFLRIESEPYDEITYNEDEEERKSDNIPKAVIRWRYKTNSTGDILKDKDGNMIRQSNARLVKWSDGSFQVIVGEDTFQGTVVEDTCSFVYGHNKSGPPDVEPDMEAQRVPCLEAISQVKHRLKLHPVTLNSQLHARISDGIRDRNKKNVKIIRRDIREIDANPEDEKKLRIQKENDEIKLERKRTRSLEPKDGSRRSSFAGLTASYLEEGSDGYDSTNISSIKRSSASKSRRKPSNYDDEEDDEEDDDDDGWEAERRKVSSKTKRQRAEDDDEEEDDEEEEEETAVYKVSASSSAGVSVADNEEEEEEEFDVLSTQKKRVRRAVIDDEED